MYTSSGFLYCLNVDNYDHKIEYKTNRTHRRSRKAPICLSVCDCFLRRCRGKFKIEDQGSEMFSLKLYTCQVGKCQRYILSIINAKGFRNSFLEIFAKSFIMGCSISKNVLDSPRALA